MKKINTIEEAYEIYGSDSLVPISFMPQSMFYIKHGVQPVVTLPKDGEQNKMTWWYLRSETYQLKKEWDATRPNRLGV